MQSSMWKLLTAAGIIGIGTLVVLDVQSRLPMPAQAAGAGNAADTAKAADTVNAKTNTDVIPDSTTDLDRMLSGAEAFDDTQFALNEPDTPADISSPEPQSGTKANVGVSPVDRTVFKDSLSDDDNPFEPSVDSTLQPELVTAAAVVVPQPQPAVKIQPASFVAESVPATATKTKKPASTPTTLFFSGNGNVSKDVAAVAPNSKTAAAVIASQTVNTTAAAAPANVDKPTAGASPAAVSVAGTDSETPDLFMPAAVPEIGRSDEPSVPELAPEVDAPLMETPGFDADTRPDFEMTPEPADPGVPAREPLPADRATGSPERSPTPEASDDKIRFFEPDVPVPTPPAGNAGSGPDTKPAPPAAFELDPVPDLDEPDAMPRATPDPGRNIPSEDDFPAPSYPDQNSRPEPNENSPFDSPPIRRNEFDDSLDLPAINDPPTRSNRDYPRGNSGDASTGAADRSISEIVQPQLSIRKRAPAKATVGVPHEYTILVSNEGDSPAYNVVVDDDLGDAARLEYSKPAAEFDRVTRKLNWTIPELAPQARQEILVRITPIGEGTLDGVATVRFKAQVASATVITAPKITLEITGPAEVKVGDEVQLRYVVRNNGTGDASNVILRSVLPPGLKHTEGGDLEYEIETLRAGDREEIDLTVVAAEPGSFRTVSEVTMSGVSADRTTTEIDIIGSQLTIQRLGPDRRFVGRTATFQNIIANETNFEANNVIVTEQVPEGMKFISADNDGEYNPETGRVRWEIARLLPHKQTVLEVELEAISAGQQQTIVEVTESAGFRSQATETTTVEDYENMTADISRQDAPVAVGETFGFTITIENRGTAVARNVEMVVSIPPEISVKAAGSKTNPARRVGSSVHYALVEAIQPAEKRTFELKLQGERPAQNALVRASLKYEHLKEPLIVTESVTIFEDRP